MYREERELEVEDEEEIPRRELDMVIERGVAQYGVKYFELLERIIAVDYELVDDLASIKRSLKNLKRLVSGSGSDTTRPKFNLSDLEDAGISQGNALRIGILAFQHSNQSPKSRRESLSSRRESSGSGIASQTSQSDEQYEDDFETLDEKDAGGGGGGAYRLPQVEEEELEATCEIQYGSGGLDGDGFEGDATVSEEYNSSGRVGGIGGGDDDKASSSLDVGSSLDYSGDGDHHGRQRRSEEEEEKESEYSRDRDWRESPLTIAAAASAGGAASSPSRHQPRGASGGSNYISMPSGGGDFKIEGKKGEDEKEELVVMTAAAAADMEVRRASSAGVGRRKSEVTSWIRDHKWKIGERIGSGSFGDVFRCMNDKGHLFAVKQLHISGQRNAVDALANEIQLMRDHDHPNIVKYIGAVVDEKGVVNIFQEWVPGGSLASLLKEMGPFESKAVANFTRQILLGLKYLHEHGIVHRDIKGGNVLLDNDGNVKLADFGASLKRQEGFDKTQETSRIMGTPYFMAPEVLGPHSKYGRKGDIWAVGCTMIQMITGQPPWKDRNLKGMVQLYLLLEGWKGGPPPYDPTALGPGGHECLELCFQKIDTNRPSAAELLECRFLKEQDDLEDSGVFSSGKFHESKQKGGKGGSDGVGGKARRRGGGDEYDADEKDMDSNGLEDSGVMSNFRSQLERLASSSEGSLRAHQHQSGKENENSDTIAAMAQQKEYARRQESKRAAAAAAAAFASAGGEDKNFFNAPLNVPSSSSQAKPVNPYARGVIHQSPRIISRSPSSTEEDVDVDQVGGAAISVASGAAVGAGAPRTSSGASPYNAGGGSRQQQRHQHQQASVSSNRDGDDLSPLADGDGDDDEVEQDTRYWTCLNVECGDNHQLLDATACAKCAVARGGTGHKIKRDEI